MKEKEETVEEKPVEKVKPVEEVKPVEPKKVETPKEKTKPVKKSKSDRSGIGALIFIFLVFGFVVVFIEDLPKMISTIKTEVRDLLESNSSNTDADGSGTITPSEGTDVVTVEEKYSTSYYDYFPDSEAAGAPDTLYEIIMPKINETGVEIDEINTEIEETYNLYEAYINVEENKAAVLTYKYYTDEETLSLVLKGTMFPMNSEAPVYTYYIYNIDLEGKETRTNNKILAMNGLVFSTATQKSVEELKASLDVIYPSLSEEEINLMIESASELSEDSNIYLNKDGQVEVALKYTNYEGFEIIAELILN